jgi:hypothetical protein
MIRHVPAGIAARGAAFLAFAAAGLTLLAGTADAAPRTPRTWPFTPPGELRNVRTNDALPGLYSDGRPCTTGCRAPGAIAGWPLRPFHGQHSLRAGLNELRPNNLHVGVDILGRDGAPVYAVQGGRVELVERGGPDARVRVGSFEYWHIRPLVAEGQQVRPYADVIGHILPGAGHLHLSEVRGGHHLNPLRPGGRVLAPWRDGARPVLGRPRFLRGGRVLMRGFDPVTRPGNRGAHAPVLGLAGLAYRLWDERGRRGRLYWAFRGTQHLPAALRRAIYARGSRPASAKCAALRHPCRPNWVYRLAGGLAPRLRVRPRRAYRLTAYAFDWAGRRSALDTRVVFIRGQAFIAPPRRR